MPLDIWVAGSYKDRSAMQDFGLAVVAGTPLLAAFVTGLRYAARFGKTGAGVGIEEHLVAVATLFSLVLIYPSWRWIRMWHFGIHIWEVRQSAISIDYDEYYRIQMVFNMFNNPILPLVKASILIVLLKIGGVLPTVRKVIWGLFVFNALVCIIPEFFLLFQCKELANHAWEPSTFGGAHCMGRRALGRLNIFQVSVSMLTDLLIFPIPIYLTMKLQKLDIRTKIFVVVLFSMSILVTALGALRIYFTYQDRIFMTSPADWTYFNIGFVVQHAENNFAIVFACIPSLRVLLLPCCGPRFKPEPSSTYLSSGEEDTSKLRSLARIFSRSSRSKSVVSRTEDTTRIVAVKETTFTVESININTSRSDEEEEQPITDEEQGKTNTEASKVYAQ